MQASHRGIPNQPETSSVESIGSEATNKNRGAKGRVPDRIATLRYRGVSYTRWH